MLPLALPLTLPLTLTLTKAWRALLEETQLMLRSGEGMHAPGVWAAANFFDEVRGARRGPIPGYYHGKELGFGPPHPNPNPHPHPHPDPDPDPDPNPNPHRNPNPTQVLRRQGVANTPRQEPEP